MVRHLDQKVYTPTRPSRLPQLQGSLPDVARFQIKQHTICIPTYLLLQAPNVFNTAMQKGESLETWIDQAENASQTHTAFDVVFTPLIYGSLDVTILIDIETTQVKYSQPNMDTENDPLHILSTVNLDLNILLNSIGLAMTIQAVEVAEMIGDEVATEYRDTLLETSQIRKIARAGGYPAKFLVEWSFEFTNSKQRTAAVAAKYHDRIGEALSVCKEYRNLIRQRLPEYKTRPEVKIQEVSRIIESNLTSESSRPKSGHKGPLVAPGGQREITRGTGNANGFSKQAGPPATEDMNMSSSEASPDSSPTPPTAAPYEPKTTRGRPRLNKRSAPGEESDDAMGETVVPRAKQARTNKPVPAALFQPPPHDTEDTALEQTEVSAQPLAVTRKAASTAADPGRSILKNTMPTTGNSAAPFKAHTGALAGPTERPVRGILPASSSPDLRTGTTLPVTLLPGHGAYVSGLGGSSGGHGSVSALVPDSDPPDALGQAWLSYLEFAPSQNEMKAQATSQAASTITHQPHNTGLAPYVDPHAKSTALGRLLAQLVPPAIAAPAPSTAAPGSPMSAPLPTFPAWPQPPTPYDPVFDGFSDILDFIALAHVPDPLNLGTEIGHEFTGADFPFHPEQFPPHSFSDFDSYGIDETGSLLHETSKPTSSLQPPNGPSPPSNMLGANDKGKGKADTEHFPTSPVKAPTDNNTAPGMFSPIMPHPLAARSGYYDPFIHGPLDGSLETGSESTLPHSLNPDLAINAHYPDLYSGIGYDLVDAVFQGQASAPAPTVKPGSAAKTLKAPNPTAKPLQSILKRTKATTNPSATSSESTSPNTENAKKKGTGKTSTDVSTFRPVKAFVPIAPKPKTVKSKATTDATSKGITSLQGSVGSFAAAVGAVETAIQRTAPANQLPRPAMSTTGTFSLLTQPDAVATVFQAAAPRIPTQTGPTQTAPIQAAPARATSTRAASTRAASTRAASTRAASTRAASTRAASTRAASTRADSSQPTTTRAASAQAAPVPAAPAQNVTSRVATAPAASTRARSTRAATAYAATAPPATTQVAPTQAAPAQAAPTQTAPVQAVTAQAATTQVALTQAATAQAATAQAPAAPAPTTTQAAQPAPEPRRSKRQNKGERSTKR